MSAKRPMKCMAAAKVLSGFSDFGIFFSVAVKSWQWDSYRSEPLCHWFNRTRAAGRWHACAMSCQGQLDSNDTMTRRGSSDLSHVHWQWHEFIWANLPEAHGELKRGVPVATATPN